ncbi:MAG: protease inhibitor I42 family protein [Nitrospira sp.]|nr:protease inhibitor I42 family protein [Nitrospira sp.]
MNPSKPDQQMAPVGETYDARLLAATVGQPIVIRLWEDRTRGELWVPSYDTKNLVLLSDDFLRIASNNAVENGQRIFEFKALTPGTHRLVFEKRMGWKFTAEDRRVFQIEAANSPSG